MEEGEKIAQMIDDGKALEEIDAEISSEHSGNTYGCALSLGIKNAANRGNAENIRQEHNLEYGVKEDKQGVVNPAVLTVQRKGE